MMELNLTGNGTTVASQTQAAAAVVWHYDDTEITQIGHAPEARKHKGEHIVGYYKGHTLRILRELKPLWPDEPHSALVQSWQGECDGVAIKGMTASHSNAIADALIAHVDQLK